VESNITFTEDIIEKVAKEFGVSFEEAMAVYKASVSNILHHMEDPECCSVTIPYIGVAHVNKPLLYKSIKNREELEERGSTVNKEEHNKNLQRIESIEKLDSERKSAGKGVSNHSKRTITRMLKRKTGKDLLEIEKIQKEKNG
jgi:hypothetical protein